MLTNPILRLARALVPATIVARASLLILGISLLLSALFAGVSSLTIQRYETARLQVELEDLLSTVEQTLRIACFVKDVQLAGEIAQGLEHSALVLGLDITAGDERLYQRVAAIEAADSMVISRNIVSPFNDDEIIGHISLQTSRAAMRAQAWAYTRAILLILGLQTLLVASVVAWIVSNLITKPIKRISDELHRLELRTGMQLHVPRINRQDEIGRLVSDVNAMIGKLSDMVDTERQLRLERERSERKLSLIFERADTGIFVVDIAGRLLSSNPAFARMLPGYGGAEAHLQWLLTPHEVRVETLLRQAADDPGGASGEFELIGADGESRWLQVSIDMIDEQQFEGVLNDITAHKLAEAAAQQLAARDPLTGLFNRRGLQAQLAARKIHPVTVPDAITALLMIDLDYFKKVNDRYGHGAGDQVLLRISSLLQEAVRRSDLVARVGGDEFVVALIDIGSVASAETIARSIIAAVRQPIVISSEITAEVGASIGLAIVSSGDATIEAALERADQALYAVKHSGRGEVRIAPPPVAAG